MKKINIQVLGTGCPSCETLYKRVLKIAGEISPDLNVEYVTDIAKIVELGAMSSPVFAIDNQIISAGRIPKEEEIEEVIFKKINKIK